VKLAATSDQKDYAFATVLSCSDSRVPAEILFDVGVMDIFVVRVAGNVANVDEVGCMEYGVGHVKTPLLVILGHSGCGAVKAVTQATLGKGHPLEKNIPPLVACIAPAVKRALEMKKGKDEKEIVTCAIEENVWEVVENIFLKSAAIRNQAKAGKLRVVGALYDLDSGKVSWLPEDKVAEILKKAEENPKREVQEMAGGGGHAEEGHAAEGHGEAVTGKSEAVAKRKEDAHEAHEATEEVKTGAHEKKELASVHE
jgi:carbonic anhydrase